MVIMILKRKNLTLLLLPSLAACVSINDHSNRAESRKWLIAEDPMVFDDIEDKMGMFSEDEEYENEPQRDQITPQATVRILPQAQDQVSAPVQAQTPSPAPAQISPQAHAQISPQAQEQIAQPPPTSIQQPYPTKIIQQKQKRLFVAAVNSKTIDRSPQREIDSEIDSIKKEQKIKILTLITPMERNSISTSLKDETKASTLKKGGASRSRISKARRSELNADRDRIINYWIRFYTGKSRMGFKAALRRGEKYRPMITRVLKKNGLPDEIYYLAMIESNFNTNAVSHAEAVGMWQIIRPTASRYGLKVNRHIDERRDPNLSTLAAINYLRDLHKTFDSWHLAMAAYNAGETRVMKAIEEAGTRDYWRLVAMGKLPKETSEYVPKILAAMTIAQNPQIYEMR
jgi:soluble lytic murein transglycosylase-like protein